MNQDQNAQTSTNQDELVYTAQTWTEYLESAQTISEQHEMIRTQTKARFGYTSDSSWQKPQGTPEAPWVPIPSKPVATWTKPVGTPEKPWK